MKRLLVVLFTCVSLTSFGQTDANTGKNSILKFQSFKGFIGTHYGFSDQNIFLSFGGPGIGFNFKTKKEKPLTVGLQIVPSINLSQSFFENIDNKLFGSVLTGPYVQYGKFRISISSQFGKPLSEQSIGLAYKF